MAGLSALFGERTVLGGRVNMPPPTVWGGLMPGSAEEREFLRPDLRTFLPGFQGGRDLARGIGEGSPGLAAWGAGQIGASFLPFLWGRTLPRTPAPLPRPSPSPSPLPAPQPEPSWMPPTGGRVTPDAVGDVLGRMGVRDIRRHRASTGTEYFHFADPHAPRLGAPEITVRVPTDRTRHPSPSARAVPGNFIDAGRTTWRRLESHPAAANAEGGRLSDWENLLDALRWRTSRDPAGGNWLVAPGREPRPPTPRPEPSAAPAGPHPDQLRLLGGAGGALTLPSLMPQRPGPEAAWRRGLRASVTIS